MGRRHGLLLLLMLLLCAMAAATAFLRPPTSRALVRKPRPGVSISILGAHAAAEGQGQAQSPQSPRHSYQHPQHWHLVLRNLPFRLCRPEYYVVLRAIVDLSLSGSGLFTRRLKVLKRKSDARPTGVAFVLLQHEWTGSVFVGERAIDDMVRAFDGVQVMGRPLRVARWVPPDTVCRAGGGVDGRDPGKESG
jgi:hypothetical protein